MQKRKLHIGTSGWSYKHWKDLFYPPKLRQADWFNYYASQFDTSEINTSFYHLPKYETVEGWAAKAPKGFTFCPKLSRYITHMKKLHEAEEPLERFFSVFQPLQTLMGPVLVQLPSMVRFKYAVAERFYEWLKPYQKTDFVLEIRHDSWLEEPSLTLMAKYGIGLVISQSNGLFPYSEMITAPNIYIRFHGPKELYASRYSDEMLEAYAVKIRNWMSAGHAVWAYFNNDIHGYAFDDARRLKALLEK
ncbi:MAG: hypothetical protein JWP88_2398 [Flaviaesturariibacter sp.]|nr:hypothetical protein [Flaviaesturariibacter sp.]